MHDDRAEFATEQKEKSLRLGTDEEMQALDLAATVRADRLDYSYVWRWLGLPIIQMPTDVVALQEVVWDERPQLIVETGVARGGSVVLLASLLQLIGEGQVLGIDVDIRAHNREAITTHPLAHRIELLDGSSTSHEILDAVRGRAAEVERVMVVLDSNHTHQHVLEELRLYAPLVTPSQFLVVADTMVERLPEQEHRPRPWGPGDNPHTAVEEFLKEDDRFERDPVVNGKLLMTSNPGGYLRRKPTAG